MLLLVTVSTHPGLSVIKDKDELVVVATEPPPKKPVVIVPEEARLTAYVKRNPGHECTVQQIVAYLNGTGTSITHADVVDFLSKRMDTFDVTMPFVHIS